MSTCMFWEVCRITALLDTEEALGDMRRFAVVLLNISQEKTLMMLLIWPFRDIYRTRELKMLHSDI